jgi:hypothetical protein
VKPPEVQFDEYGFVEDAGLRRSIRNKSVVPRIDAHPSEKRESRAASAIAIYCEKSAA